MWICADRRWSLALVVSPWSWALVRGLKSEVRGLI